MTRRRSWSAGRSASASAPRWPPRRQVQRDAATLLPPRRERGIEIAQNLTRLLQYIWQLLSSVPETRTADLQRNHPFRIMSHYNEDELSAYALRPRPPMTQSGPSSMCPAAGTAETPRRHRAFDTALQDPLPWEVPRRCLPAAKLRLSFSTRPAPSLPPTRTPRAGDAAVDSAIRFREARIDQIPVSSTLAVIRLLCKVANGMHERQPQFGPVLADNPPGVEHRQKLRSR